MPLYEYRCLNCRRKNTLFFRSMASVEADPACPSCGAHGMRRLMSRFWAHRSTTSASGDALDDAWLADGEYGEPGSGAFDDVGAGAHDVDDPVDLARQTREMAAMFGEPLEPELERALSQIERGADPEDVLGELDESDAAALDGSLGMDEAADPTGS